MTRAFKDSFPQDNASDLTQYRRLADCPTPHTVTARPGLVVGSAALRAVYEATRRLTGAEADAFWRFRITTWQGGKRA